MRKRDLIKEVVKVMMEYRFERGRAMLRDKLKNERLIPKQLSRNAEAEAIINLVRTFS